ncbi:hypothetical protein ABFX02_05G020100 [Erythranthe guttata]
MKTIERAHMPKKLWERVKLPRNYEKALEIIDKHLIYWPKLLVHKTKQRLTKMTQMRIRMRKLALKTREKIMTVPTKEKKREARREEKAEKAAQLDNVIEKELVERLEQGLYGDLYPIQKYKELLSKEAEMNEMEEEEEYGTEYVEGYEELEEEEDMEDFGGRAMINDDADMDDDDDEEDDEETVYIDRKRDRKSSARKLEKEEPNSKSKKKVRVHVEVEHEDAPERQRAVL